MLNKKGEIMNTQTNVSVGKPAINGAVYRAPLGTTLPTTASEDLDSAFVGLGYASEDGLTNTNSATTEDIKAWGGDIVLQPITEKADTFNITFIESKNIEILKAVYGDENVTGDLASGITVKANSKEVPASAWVIDMILTGGTLKRVVIPNGQPNLDGDISYKDNEAVGYPIKITAYPGGSDFDNDTHKEYIIEATSSQGGDDQADPADDPVDPSDDPDYDPLNP